MNTLDFREGQTYVCVKSDKSWWTVGKEYPVVLNSCGIPVLVDNGDDRWSANALNAFNNEFKLKENIFDLNTLSTEQLIEYVDLLEDKENAERLLNEFIERMSKQCLNYW